MWSRRVRILVVVVAVVAGTGGGRARADDAGVFPVEIATSETAQAVELAGPSGRATCRRQACKLELGRGRYYVVVTDADEHIFSEWLDIQGPRRIAVAPGNQNVRVAGAMMFVGGLVGAATGGVMTFLALYGHASSGLDGPNGCVRDCDSWRPWAIAGGITLAASVAVGATGLVVWRRNRRAVITDAPVQPPPSPVAQWRLAPAVGSRSTGLALAATF